MLGATKAHRILALRAAVGAVGEIRGWWNTTVRFGRFDRLFPRTHVRAQIAVLSAAAAAHHDAQALPRQRAYHLFRLVHSREIELVEPMLDIGSLVVPETEDHAFELLDAIAALDPKIRVTAAQGPIKLGEVRRLQHHFESELAAAYLAAARQNTVVVPYYEG